MASTISYTIKPGDSLSSIAAAHLGDYRRWTEIYNLNKAIIANPDVIQAGVTIQLPAAAAAIPAASSSGVITSGPVPVVQPKNFLMYGAAALMALSVLPIIFMKKKPRAQEQTI